MKFFAFDNNCYLTYITGRRTKALINIQTFFDGLQSNSLKYREDSLEGVINNRTCNFVLKFSISVLNLLEDKYQRKLLKEFSKDQSEKNKNKLGSFIDAVDDYQFDTIVKSALIMLRRTDFRICHNNSQTIRNFIDKEYIKLKLEGKKSNPVSNAMFRNNDSEDALVFEEIYAIKEKSYEEGIFYSEDKLFIEEAEKLDSVNVLGIDVKHAEKLNA